MQISRAQIGLLVFAVLNVVVGAVAVSSLLPIGDGKVSSEPKSGYVFACSTRFGGSGAFKDGPWIQGSSWNPELKISIQGSVKWNSKIMISLENSKRVIRSNNLPDHATGTFPVASSDPAYQYDRNPNKIREQNILLELPANRCLECGLCADGDDWVYLVWGGNLQCPGCSGARCWRSRNSGQLQRAS
jgi:hypothetical protein